MASTYSQATATIMSHRNHSSEHLHEHVHDHAHSFSQSPPSVNSQSPGIRPSKTAGDRPGHSHWHSNGHDHSHSQTRANVPQPLNKGGHFRTGSTAGGKPLITPTNGSFDSNGTYEAPPEAEAHHDHKHDHGAHDHSVTRSKFTGLLLPYTARWPLLHAIMTDKDSRRIFYFISLNFSFMAVQAFYGYVTDSLGLLSDSIHMFFDCVALAVGLFAAIASKWPPSEQFPYGFGKIETLSGFANGVFLMLISVEIMFEAVERILEGKETKRLTELFIVSTMGLLVNLVGMMAFGHHHHGHDHGHGHGHSHGGHSHDHEHKHDEKHELHDHDHDHDHKHEHPEQKEAHSHCHGHSHDNENMHGIYLHVLADTLGSGAVIVSTVLTHFFPWSGWDPLASFLIAVLILLSALPLVKSSARRLLLTIPDEIEYNLRDTLSGITGLRGVASYGVPRFWLDDRSAESGSGTQLLGVMHVVAVRGADMEDVRDRVRAYMLDKGIEITVQVEREGDTSCWCGLGRSALSPLGHGPKQSVYAF